jgi:hypothetical protein
MEDTPRPTIDPESPVPALLRKMRRNELAKRIPKYEKKDYAKMYRVMKKYRSKQEKLLEEYESDPDPYDPSYVFYCFTGKLEE